MCLSRNRYNKQSKLRCEICQLDKSVIDVKMWWSDSDVAGSRYCKLCMCMVNSHRVQRKDCVFVCMVNNIISQNSDHACAWSITTCYDKYVYVYALLLQVSYQ